MPDPQGLAYFPGVNRVISATMSVVRGISPSVCTITMDPQSSISNTPGTLVFQFGNVYREWPDAKPDFANLQLGSDGYSWVVNFFDRRWKWRFGEISGSYNVWRDDYTLCDGKVDPEQANTQDRVIDTRKTPQELAELCLKALGEDNYDVSALPNESNPPTDWDGDNPAEALAELCESLGCEVTLRTGDNKVVIVVSGEGAGLPTDGVMIPSYNLDAPEMPDKIGVRCGANRYQVDFELEAVALDIPESPVPPPDSYEPSGAIIKLLPDVSWAIDPLDAAGGFTYGDLPYFTNVENDGIGYADDVSGRRQLAVMSAFRYYRIKMPVEIPGYGQVTRLEQIILEDEQITTWWINYDNANLPAYVYGRWFDGIGDLKNTCDSLTPAGIFAWKKPPNTREVFWRRGFTIDLQHGIVILSEPCIRNTDSVDPPAAVIIAPAELRLRCACSIRDDKTLAVVRHTRERETGAGFGTKTQWLQHDEIVLNHIPKYSDSFSVQSVKTNLDEGFNPQAGGVNEACDHYIDGAIQQYQLTEALQMQYGGLRTDIEVDGAIQQITYVVGDQSQGCFTIASRGTEMHRYVLPFKERRRIERAKKAQADAAKARGKGGSDKTKRDKRQKGSKI